MKEHDLLVRSWEPDNLAEITQDGLVILVGKGARHDVMVGWFNDIILAIIPTITMAIPSWITDGIGEVEGYVNDVMHVCPFILYADIERVPANREVRFRELVGHAVASEKWFDFDTMSLSTHAKSGTLFASDNFTIYKGMVAANRMQVIYHSMDDTPFWYDNPLYGKNWVVDKTGLPLILDKPSILEKEERNGTSRDNPNHVSRDDTE